jgi:hypothetical protein
MTEKQGPPNFRFDLPCCSNCKHCDPYDSGGTCEKYRWPITGSAICDDYEAETLEGEG